MEQKPDLCHVIAWFVIINMKFKTHIAQIEMQLQCQTH